MARYLSVEETATVLGTTDRTVRRMLNEGRLSGSQQMEKGKMIWRVNATKDLLQKLEALASSNPVVESKDKTEGDIEEKAAVYAQDADADAEVLTDSTSEDSSSAERAWFTENKANAAKVANDFWKELEAKYLLKLLAQENRIGSLEQELRQRDETIKELSGAKEEEAVKLLTYKTDEQLKVEQLVQERNLLERKQREAEDRAREAEQKAKAERDRLEIIKTAEIEAVKRLAAEGELKRKIVSDEAHQNDVTKLREEIEKLKTPWWKKMFSAPKS